MKQQPRIVTLQEKKMVGNSLRMSLIKNTTSELWKSFIPLRKQIPNVIGEDLFSIQVYDNLDYFRQFDPKTEFTKYAAVEVSNHDSVPLNMESFSMPGGVYAVFIHKGANTNQSTFEYIFREWLPPSDYEIDNRPHFEVLGKKYVNNSPHSEEEVWIPIKIKV